MAMVKKSITVTDQQSGWIRSQIDGGLYGNESEVIRELIRERQLREQEATSGVDAIRAKLIRAEQSGFTDQTAEEVLRDIKNGLGREAIQAK